MSTLMTIVVAFLAAVVVLGPLIALHEWGHYIVARLCGVKVLTYSIGFGPKIASWVSPRSGIDYCLSALPFGGYVKMLDEREAPVPEAERHLAFNRQHPLKKIAIVAAGPLMNFVIAIVLFMVLFMTPSEQLNTRVFSLLPNTPAATVNLPLGERIVAIDGRAVQTWEEINYRLADRMGESGVVKVSLAPMVSSQPTSQSVQSSSSASDSSVSTDKVSANTVTSAAVKTYELPIQNFMQGEAKGEDAISALGAIPWQPSIPPIIGQLDPQGAGSLQGLAIGDRITAINDTPISQWTEVTRIIRANPEVLLTIQVLRDGKPLTLPVMPQTKKDTMGMAHGYLGAGVKPIEIVVPADYKTEVAYTPLMALNKAFAKTGQLAQMTLSSMGKMISGTIGVDNLSGPITIAAVAKQSFSISWEMVLSTAGLISLSLAVLNLLPIPVLDGGHLVYYFIELVRGRPVPERLQIIGFNIGFVLLAGFMLLAIGNDLSRYWPF